MNYYVINPLMYSFHWFFLYNIQSSVCVGASSDSQKTEQCFTKPKTIVRLHFCMVVERVFARYSQVLSSQVQCISDANHIIPFTGPFQPLTINEQSIRTVHLSLLLLLDAHINQTVSWPIGLYTSESPFLRMYYQIKSKLYWQVIIGGYIFIQLLSHNFKWQSKFLIIFIVPLVSFLHIREGRHKKKRNMAVV